MYILLSGIRSLGAGKQTLKNFYLKQISKKAGVKLVYTPKMPFFGPPTLTFTRQNVFRQVRNSPTIP